MRTTIDFGIDLGTTNSSIAALRGTGVEVFKNNERAETTPSAVWIDRNGALVVGRRAYERLETDPENAASEFKPGMGTPREYLFARSGRRLTSPELSAEVLKSLKADVKQRTGEEVEAAVITVPAAFELQQSEATSQAAKMAGLAASPLLQEPIAAAQAYAFQSRSDKVFWLIYDFGGGTFDAAVVNLRDRDFQVINHGGDNHLGGKLIDWAIVEQLMIPALLKERRLTDFRRGNYKWRPALAKMKIEAERAKISLSHDESFSVSIDSLCKDDRNEAVDFECTVSRRDLETLAEPFILQSLNLCKKVLSERRLGVGDVEKVILVGGPTLMPYLRGRLTDGLGIPLEFERDPMTVVAQGAAIFAGTQRCNVKLPSIATGQYAITHDLEPVGADSDPTIGGIIAAPPGANFKGFTIQFVNRDARPEWASGREPIQPNGAFLAPLWAQKEIQNVFLIKLYDENGRLQQTVPETVSYTIGIGPGNAPLTHSVGVALANDEMLWVLEKGVALPAVGRRRLRTNRDFRRGDSGQLLRIPLMEGENRRADRNEEIGRLEIAADQLKRDVPAGSAVDFTIKVDSSRLVKATAYIEILDEEFEKVLVYESRQLDTIQLREQFEEEKRRLDCERSNALDGLREAKASQAIQRIEGERMIYEVESALAAADADPDAKAKAVKRLLVLRVSIDDLVDAVKWPGLVSAAEKEVDVERSIIADPQAHASAEDKAAFVTLEREILAAIQTRDHDVLKIKVREMDRLGYLIVSRQPGWWIGRLRYLETMRVSMTNSGFADSLIAHAHRAIQTNDFENLQAMVQQLGALLPDDSDDPSAKRVVGVVQDIRA